MGLRFSRTRRSNQVNKSRRAPIDSFVRYRGLIVNSHELTRVQLPWHFRSVHHSYPITRTILYRWTIPTYGPVCQPGHGRVIHYSARRGFRSRLCELTNPEIIYEQRDEVSLFAIRKRRFDCAGGASHNSGLTLQTRTVAEYRRHVFTLMKVIGNEYL